MALEVIWTRAFYMILKTSVYAFALVLSVYLLATWIGSLSSRRWRVPYAQLFPYLSISGLPPDISQ